MTASTDVAIDDVNTSFFDSLLQLNSDNLLHGALGVAALSTTYALGTKSGSMSPVVNSASEELREERKTTAALRRQVETVWRPTRGGKENTRELVHHLF